MFLMLKVLSLAVMAARSQSADAANMQEMAIGNRTYEVYSPASLGNRPAPLLVALHGGLGNAGAFADSLPMFATADRLGFRVVYPNGTITTRRESANRRTWNAGTCCGQAAKQGVDDVGFLTGIIAAFEKQGLLAPGEVFLVGHSNGAMMSYRLACEKHRMVRGVVAISGPLALPSCPSAAGVRVLHLHGADDDVVPPGGGRGSSTLDTGSHQSVQETERKLTAAGAKVDVVMLSGAGHLLPSVSRAAQRQMGATLPDIVGGFIVDNR